MTRHTGQATPSGPQLAAELQARHGDEDWIAALAKGAVLPRAEIEQVLASSAAVPPDILEAARSIEQTLEPGVPGHEDNVFKAQTNDGDAPMEVDAEAGMTVTPGAKMAPSKSGSPHEMGEREGKFDPTRNY